MRDNIRNSCAVHSLSLEQRNQLIQTEMSTVCGKDRGPSALYTGRIVCRPQFLGCICIEHLLQMTNLVLDLQTVDEQVIIKKHVASCI